MVKVLTTKKTAVEFFIHHNFSYLSKWSFLGLIKNIPLPIELLCGSGEEVIVGEGRFQQTLSYHAWIMETHFIVMIWSVLMLSSRNRSRKNNLYYRYILIQLFHIQYVYALQPAFLYRWWGGGGAKIKTQKPPKDMFVLCLVERSDQMIKRLQKDGLCSTIYLVLLLLLLLLC